MVPEKLKAGWKGPYLESIHQPALASSHGTSLPVFPLCQRSSKIFAVKLLARVPQEFMYRNSISEKLQYYPKNPH